MRQCFLLETLGLVGMDLSEEDIEAMAMAPHCQRLKALRVEKMVSLSLGATRK